MRSRLKGHNLPRARVSFYVSNRGAYSPTRQRFGLGAAQALAHQKIRRGIALRVEVDLPDPRDCDGPKPWHCYNRHPTLPATVYGCFNCTGAALAEAVAAAQWVMPKISFRNTDWKRAVALYLFDGARSETKLALARRVRDAVVCSLRQGGYWVTIVDDDGESLKEPTRPWTKGSCYREHVKVWKSRVAS